MLKSTAKNLTVTVNSTASSIKNIAKSFTANITSTASLTPTFKAAAGAAKRLYSAIVIGRF
jgi:hypothetical protein